MSLISEFDALSPVSPVSRFDSFFDVYGLSLKQQADLEQRTITLITRSPASAPANALATNLARFQPLSVEVNIIFAQIAPAEALDYHGAFAGVGLPPVARVHHSLGKKSRPSRCS